MRRLIAREAVGRHGATTTATAKFLRQGRSSFGVSSFGATSFGASSSFLKSSNVRDFSTAPVAASNDLDATIATTPSFDKEKFAHLTSIEPIKKSVAISASDEYEELQWSKNFGSRNSTIEITHLKRGHPEYIEVGDIVSKGVDIVTTVEQARIVVENLMKHGETDPTTGRPIFHACDTEVMAIDLKKVGPIGNGYVTCMSMYSGPEFDYGLGGGKGRALFVDNLDESEGVMAVFKEVRESENEERSDDYYVRSASLVCSHY